MKYKVGDKVIILAKSMDSTGIPPYSDNVERCIGETGFIEKIFSDNRHSVCKKINSPDSYMGLFLPEELELVTKSSEPKKEFKREWDWQPLYFGENLYGPTKAMPWYMTRDFPMGNEGYITKPSLKGGEIMGKLTNMAKRYLSPSVKKLMKANYITDGFNRTSLGTDALIDILWQKHEKELLDAATKQIKADKKAKKNEDCEDEE